MTHSQMIRRAMKTGDYKHAQMICDDMRGAQAYNWQRKIDRALEAVAQSSASPSVGEPRTRRPHDIPPPRLPEQGELR